MSLTQYVPYMSLICPSYQVKMLKEQLDMCHTYEG